MASRLLPVGRRIVKLLDISYNRPFSYKSSLSLDKLYPESSLKLTTPDFIPEDPNAKFNGYIPMNKLKITYSCSSGPGGQNVNKVSTKVDLRFKVSEADWLDEELRNKIIKEHYNKLTVDGYLIIRSEVTRSQQLNLADCLRKLRALIRKTAQPERTISEETLQMLRKRKEKANRERLYVKRADSLKRQERQTPTLHDL